MNRSVKTITLLSLATIVSGVSVDHIIPQRADPPRLWASYDQDNYALGDDDGYTAGVRLGWRLDSDVAGPWTITASWSVYTKRDADMRSDEVFISFQREIVAGNMHITAGPALLGAGDFGGSSVQHEVHRAFGDERYDLGYEQDRWLPVLAATARWEVWSAVTDPSPLGRSAVAVNLRGGVLVHSEEIRGQLGLPLVYDTATGGTLQLEPLVELVAGEGASRSTSTAHALNPGVQAFIFTDCVHIGLTLVRDRAYGTIGITF